MSVNINCESLRVKLIKTIVKKTCWRQVSQILVVNSKYGLSEMRRLIGRAKPILSERRACSWADSFTTLAGYGQRLAVAIQQDRLRSDRPHDLRTLLLNGRSHRDGGQERRRTGWGSDRTNRGRRWKTAASRWRMLTGGWRTTTNRRPRCWFRPQT